MEGKRFATRPAAVCAAAALGIALASSASAQEVGRYRHFEQPLTDTNRSDRIVYVPVVMAVSGARPASMPYNAASAAWFRQSLGSSGTRPDVVLDKADYTLERLEKTGKNGSSRLRVVITRRGKAASGGGLPELRVVDPGSGISSGAFPRAEALPEGVRYTYLVTPPDLGLGHQTRGAERAHATRYELRFMPAADVRPPRYMTGLPTFSGKQVDERMDEPRPQLPYQERVAGRRIEYRDTRAGRVVDQKVAGSREERRER